MEGGFATTWGASHGQGKDIRDARSDTLVFNSGLVRAQPIRGVIAFDHKGCYLHFGPVLVVHVSYKFPSCPRWSHYWYGPKILFFN